MRSLRGRVAACSKLVISGWALSPDDDEYRPELEIKQGGRVVQTLIPNIADPGIRPVLKLPKSRGDNLCRWQIMLPLSGGIAPDQAFTIQFRDNKQPLEQGCDLVLPLFDAASSAARQRVDDYVFVVHSYRRVEQHIEGAFFVSARDLLSVSLTVNGEAVGEAVNAVENRPGHILIHPSVHIPLNLPRRLDPHTVVSLQLKKTTSEGVQKLDDAQAMYIPAEVFNQSKQFSPIPEGENIRRVAGDSTELHFLISGFSQFMQMNALAQKHFRKAITQFKTICDWGVGCGRLLRYFPDSTTDQPQAFERLVGLDIDDFNIAWCKDHLPFAEFYLLDRHEPRLPLQDLSVDLLYAISVMTHLSEYNQQRWLQELYRVVKPGGCVILTVNGEVAFYQRPELLQHYFTEKFGFSDLQPDTTFGEELSSYYRVTYQTQEFIEREWSKFFDILEIFPAKQNYVVMRRKRLPVVEPMPVGRKARARRALGRG